MELDSTSSYPLNSPPEPSNREEAESEEAEERGRGIDPSLIALLGQETNRNNNNDNNNETRAHLEHEDLDAADAEESIYVGDFMGMGAFAERPDLQTADATITLDPNMLPGVQALITMDCLLKYDIPRL